MTRLTQKRIDQIRALIEEGWSDRAIEKELQTSRHTTSAIRSGEITQPPERKRRRVLSYHERMEIRERLSRGEPGKDVAEAYGVTPSAISRIKHKRNCANDLAVDTA